MENDDESVLGGASLEPVSEKHSKGNTSEQVFSQCSARTRSFAAMRSKPLFRVTQYPLNLSLFSFQCKKKKNRNIINSSYLLITQLHHNKQIIIISGMQEFRK